MNLSCKLSFEVGLESDIERVESSSQTYRVGLMTSAPTSFLLSLVSLLIRRSRMGMTKASVFPEPVTASTTTSLCCINSGIVEA